MGGGTNTAGYLRTLFSGLEQAKSRIFHQIRNSVSSNRVHFKVSFVFSRENTRLTSRAEISRLPQYYWRGGISLPVRSERRRDSRTDKSLAEIRPEQALGGEEYL
jgi:hypothetical protein